jgi:two-component system, sensor histidine kinase LadS
MKDIFSQLGPSTFEDHFSDDEKCLEVLAAEKWKEGYVCRKCSNTNYCAGKSPHSRRCTRCKHDESATAHTIFHRCKIPVREAFKIAFMVCCNPDVSSYDLSRSLELRQMTCWKFKKKISDCLEQKGYLSLADNIAG